MAPKISIIVPAFNEEKYISRCLDSILTQTFSDFEVICIDDGSTDNTFKILTEYSEKDSRIIPLKNSGKGVSSARNFGIENSHGEYIGFVDSDDFIQPQMYEFLYKALSENNGDMAICGCKRTGVQNNIFFEYNYKEYSATELINEYKIDSFLCIWTKLIKKEILKNKIRFENFRIGEDSLFCSNLWINSSKVLFVDLPLYNYFTNPNGVFSNNLSSEKWLDQIRTHYLAFKNFTDYKENYPSVWFLENGIKFLLSYRLFSKKNKDKNNKKEIRKLYKKYFKEYKNCSDISLANKIYVFISYHFPLLYEVRRKLLDKTIR
ncbi:MAG: glycosyltransferase [Clostridia bacterium]|nr:glycosyltransferase [Clostridia bacterium]